MHAITLAELASSFVGVASTLLHQRLLPRHEAAQALWTQHRSRCDEWNHRLASHREAMYRTGSSSRTRKWQEVMPVLQEILLTEPLTRTLACFASRLEELQLSDEFSPLLHSNLVSHIEARNRCLNLIVFGHGLSVESAVRLNRMRRNLENYSDQLLATLPSTANIEAYCFNARAIVKTRLAVGQLRSPASFHGHWLHLHMRSLASQIWRNMQSDIDWRAANGRLNHRISQAVLALLPPQVFDGVGVPHRVHSIISTRNGSPESDGTVQDPAASSSPMDLVHQSKASIRSSSQLHGRRRW